jgi:hypothetical protein
MLASEASQTRSLDPQARLGLSRAALRHLALLLLLTPLLGGLRILVDHPDQRAENEPIVVREVVEVPVPTLIIIEVPAPIPPATGQPSVPNAPTTAPSANVPVAETASAAGASEEVRQEIAGDGEATDGSQFDPSPVVANVPARSNHAAPIRQVFEPQTAGDQLPSEPLAETPSETDVVAEGVAAEDVVAEEIAPAAPLSPAQQSLANFYAYTDQNWSVQGYSSADEMRDILGNGTTGWLNETSLEASAELASAETVAKQEIPPSDESESTAESIAVVQPVADSAPASDGFYTYTEENWSALGYSSAEDMRRSLTAN